MNTFTLEDAIRLTRLGEYKAAENMFRLLSTRYPESWEIFFHWATLYTQVQINAVAIPLLHRCLQIRPKTSQAWNNLGTLYRRENQTKQAERALKRGLKLAPDDADLNNNMGTLFINEGRADRGEFYLRKAISQDDSLKEAHWNLGLLLLESGQWREGWQQYHHGVESKERMNRWATWPYYKGGKGKVMVFGEQGIGDEIMFSSILADIERDADKVILECHPRLESVFKRSFPKIKVYPTRKLKVVDFEEDFDYRIAMGDLGMIYRNDNESFPKQPYLRLDENKVSELKQRMAAYPKPWVGVGWRGGYKKTRKDLRSLPLEDWRKTIESTDGTWFSLQYNVEADAEVDVFNQKGATPIVHWPDVVRAHDYGDILAFMSLMDVVVHVNGSAVHGCGAIGQHCITLTPSKCAWRYGTQGDQMPFYGPWVQQIRQKNDDWQDVMRRLRVALGGVMFSRQLARDTSKTAVHA